MITAENLNGLGLSPKASQIYLAALASGTSSVQTLANKAGLKRPTAYLHLQELLEAGLLEKVPVGKKDYYLASSPQKLEYAASERLMKVKQVMPELLALQNAATGKPGVTVLEGRKGMAEVYKEISTANSIRFWTDLSVFEHKFADMFRLLSEAIQQNQIRTREIIADTPEARRSSKRYAVTAGKFYSSRVSTVAGLQNDSAVYNNVLALFRIHEYNLYVVRIEDVTIAETMKALFDMAWHSAKPFVN